MYCEKCGALLENGKCPNCDQLIVSQKEKSSNRGMTVFAIVLSVLSIGLLLGGFYVLSSPKTIVLQSVSNWSGFFKNGFQDSRSDSLKKLLSSDNVQLDESIELELDPTFGFGFDKISLDFLYNDNKEDQESNFKTKFSIGEDALDLDGILKDNKLYVQVKDIFTKYYFLDTEYFSYFEEADTSDLDKLVDIVFDNIKENIKSGDFTKSKETIHLGEKTKKTTKISYEVTSHRLATVVIDILEDIKNDQDLMNALSESSVEGNDFLNQIEELTNLLKTVLNQKDTTLFYYNVYYYGFNNIVMEEIADSETSIRYMHYQDVNEFKILDIMSGVNYFSLKLEDLKNETSISGFILTYPYSGSYTKSNQEKSLKLSLDFGGSQKINLEMTENEKTENDCYQVDGRFVITGNGDLFDLGKGITISTSVTVRSTDKVDINVPIDATNFNEMTDEEMMVVLDSLRNHPLTGPIITFFEQYQSSVLPDDSLDFDMDYDSSLGDDWYSSLEESSL